MKNGTTLNRLWRDRAGAALLEFTVVFPLVMLVAFCTVDFSLVLFDWAQANKAVQRGTRVAVVANPVAGGLNDPAWTPTLIGEPCFDPDTGEANGNCPAIETVCIPTAAGGNCIERINGAASSPPIYPFDNDAFTPIFSEMQRLFPRLRREHVQIAYRTTGLSFVGRPGGLSMEVTVQLRCITHEVFFLAALAGWAFTEPGDGCPDGPPGPPIPAYATTLTSEALGSEL